MRQPKLSLRLISLFSRAIYSESVKGDCREMYEYIYHERGKIKAWWWLWKQVLTSMPLFFINSIEWGFIMFKNYIKITLRNMWKHKGFSFINISGLAIGLACCILILLWVQDETSYDEFHENKTGIYRILSVGDDSTWDGLPAPLAPAIEKEIPGIIKAVRLLKSPKFVFKYEEQSFYEENGIIADPSFFDVFTFPFLKGNPQQALSTPFSVVISERMARKYFGDLDPVNKSLNIEGRASLKVTGIIKNVPANSHLRFEYVLPFDFAKIAGLRGMAWGDFNFKTYVHLEAHSSSEDIAKKINDSARQHGCPQVVQKQVSLSLQPLPGMYLHPLSKSDTNFGNIKFVRIFSLIALCILIIASINFVNLTTARSENRAKEIGIRKVLGGRRSQLIRQFFGESLVLTFIALVFASILVRLLLPAFNNLTGKNLVFQYSDPGIMLGLFLVTLLAGILAGFYPAVFLSSFKPVDVIKGNTGAVSFFRGRAAGLRGSGSFRKVLVVMQFSVSIILIICSLIVYEQLNFIKNKSWKLEDDLIVHVPVRENIGNKYETVKAELLKSPQITGAALKDCLPTGLRNNTSGVYWPGKTQAHNDIYMETTRISFGYFKTMDMEITAGRDFSKEFPTDLTGGYILNETAVKVAGIKDPVGKMFQLYRKKGVIVGVVKDTHFKSMKRTLNPQVYYLFTDIPKQAFFGYLFIKIKRPDELRSLSQTISHIENTWNKVNSIAPFEYAFLDETIDNLYKNERRLGKIFTSFAFLAIFISCLGLFGLSSFLIEKRTREIGIRKTLGASVRHLVIMLSQDFSKWVLLANIIAIPLAWYAMKAWLQNFAYQTAIDPWIFILAGSAALIIALLTVVFQSLKAAGTNPVDALRCE